MAMILPCLNSTSAFHVRSAVTMVPFLITLDIVFVPRSFCVAFDVVSSFLIDRWTQWIDIEQDHQRTLELSHRRVIDFADMLADPMRRNRIQLVDHDTRHFSEPVLRGRLDSNPHDLAAGWGGRE